MTDIDTTYKTTIIDTFNVKSLKGSLQGFFHRKNKENMNDMYHFKYVVKEYTTNYQSHK